MAPPPVREPLRRHGRRTMILAGALARGRRLAESLMTDTVTITRPGAPTTDPATGEVVTSGTVVYEGRARWKPPTTGAAQTETGTAAIITSPGEVHIPVGSYTPEPGDIIECTACPMDPGMVGRRATVQSRFGGSQVTAYRIPIEG